MYQTSAHDEAALHRTYQSSDLWSCRINAVSQYYSTHGLQNMKSDMIGIHRQEFEAFVSQNKYLQKKTNDSIVMTTARRDEVKLFLQRKRRKQDKTFT